MYPMGKLEEILDHMGEETEPHLAKFGDRPRLTFDKDMRSDIGMTEDSTGLIIVPHHKHERVFMGLVVSKENITRLSKSIVGDLDQ